jgi:hypothetical protein
VVSELATTAPDGGSKARASDGGIKKVHSTFEKQTDEQDEEEQTNEEINRGHPSSQGTGRRISRVA